MTRYSKAHDLDSWLHDSRIDARGFAHRWTSAISDGNGEDAFVSLVERHLTPASDVLDVGCGHGELALDLAPRCRSIVGIDRNSSYLQLANELAAERQLTNARFIEVDLSNEPWSVPPTRMPLEDYTIDLFINRRGPVLRRYLDEAMRVARPGATILGLHPAGNTVAPVWREQLPDPYRDVFVALPFEEVAGWVRDPLTAAGIADYELWWIDVTEWLRDARELYARLSEPIGSNAPPFADVAEQFERIVRQHATPEGVVVRHQRLLWQATIGPPGR